MVNQLKNNKEKVYSFMLGKCTNELQAELKGLNVFDKKDTTFYRLWTLKQAKLISYGIKQRYKNDY